MKENQPPASVRVFLYGSGQKRSVKEAAAELERRLCRHKAFTLVGKDLEFSKDLSGVDVDVIVALGGDGTVLYLARHLNGRQLPVLSANVGKLGFLAEARLADVVRVLEAFKHARARESRRTMLQCDLLDGSGNRKCHFRALNDAVVSREAGRMIALEVSCRGGDGSQPIVPVMSFAGDGVIISTPTGSTAYSLSAGGPILDAELDNILIVPICAHSLSTRPVVLGGDQTVLVRLATSSQRASLMVDGQEGAEMQGADTLEVTRAPEPFLLVTTGKSWFQTVREKLNWNTGTAEEGRPTHCAG